VGNRCQWRRSTAVALQWSASAKEGGEREKERKRACEREREVVRERERRETKCEVGVWWLPLGIEGHY